MTSVRHTARLPLPQEGVSGPYPLGLGRPAHPGGTRQIAASRRHTTCGRIARRPAEDSDLLQSRKLARRVTVRSAHLGVGRSRVVGAPVGYLATGRRENRGGAEWLPVSDRGGRRSSGAWLRVRVSDC
jgi:hypothetical protein